MVLTTATKSALAAATNPIRWEMMASAYQHLMLELGEPWPDVYVGSKVPPYLGLPVEIVAGAQKGWKLVSADAS